MRDRLEDIWTESICELLRKELDSNRYEVNCFEKVPYSIFVNGYKNGIEDLEMLKYEVDLLIKEKRDNYAVPRLIIESKYKKISTHDAITYSDKAKCHKDIFCGLRYGIMVGNSNDKYLPSRVLNHGNDFDFMFIFQDDKPNDKEWKLFVDIVKRNLESANKFEDIIKERRKREKKRYFCIESDLKFYE